MQEGASTPSCCECGRTSSWLRERSDPKCDVSGDEAARMRHIAETDVADIERSDILIIFEQGAQEVLNCRHTLADFFRLARGGRELELGMAIAFGLRIIVMGQKRLNIFEYLPQVEWVESWNERTWHYEKE